DRADRLEGVGWTRVARAVAALGHVARACRGPADTGGLRVRGARRTRPGAVLRDVTDARGRPADGRGRLEAIGQAGVARAGGALRDVARPRRRPALGRALRIRGTLRARPRAALGHVADPGRGSTDGGRRLERIGRAAVARAVAALGHVARARRGPADIRALRVRGARRARAGAALGDVTDAGRRPADGGGRLEAIGRTAVARAVA